MKVSEATLDDVKFKIFAPHENSRVKWALIIYFHSGGYVSGNYKGNGYAKKLLLFIWQKFKKEGFCLRTW